ncbi:hypothetical protein T439DRAFT_328239 [Meredithblackwellia eburnea MCA 4105]
MAPGKGLDIPSSSKDNRTPSPLPAGQASPYGSPSVPQIPPPSNNPTPSYGTPRTASPFIRPDSANSHSNAPTPTTNIDDLTEAQKAAIVRRHLLSAEEQRAAAESAASLPGTSPRNLSAWTARDEERSSSSNINTGDEAFPAPYSLPGGDIVAPIYKWAAQQQQEASGVPGSAGSQTPSLRRSRSMASINSGRRVSHGGALERPNVSFTAGATGAEDEDENSSAMGVREILEPGGFRRDFVIRRMAERGETPVAGRGRFTPSFTSFLVLYGHFGGEDLEEIEEESSDEMGDEEEELGFDESTIRGYDGSDGLTPRPTRTREVVQEDNERTPLVRRTAPSTLKPDGRPPVSRGLSRKRASSVGQHGDATVTQAVLMLLKSFVGTGVLFLGKAFYNGGIVFSTVVLCFIAMTSLYSFLLLVETRLVVPGSFGDIGGTLYGKYMRLAILFSIVLSQIGFVAAYTIFVSQNLQAFFMAVTNCRTFIPISILILVQLVLFLPLAMIRNIQKLSGTALIADAFILFGLVYIFSNEIGVLASNGLADVALFNSKDFPLLIGTAVFSFEGIGLVIPITESMKDPHKFPRVLTGVMVGVMILFAGAGVLAYAAYGSEIQTVVFVNLPQEDRVVNFAQFLYSIAILLSTPLQLFPAVRIMENGIFSRSGKHSFKVKWEKNTFRMAVVVGCSLVSWLGASDLDKFVSLIGSVACVPLCFCYPALLHYKACATTKKQKIADIALFVFGIAAAVYTTSQTITLLVSGGESAPPKFGKCPPHI